MANEAVSDSTFTAVIFVPAARLAIAAAAAVLLLLASLHVLSPEFDPSWRVISEYANGRYGWVLSMMFVAWAVSSWALAFTIRSQVKTGAGKLGLGFLVAAGVGEAMASVLRYQPSSARRGWNAWGSLSSSCRDVDQCDAWPYASVVSREAGALWTANLTWMILVLMIKLCSKAVGRTPGLLRLSHQACRVQHGDSAVDPANFAVELKPTPGT